MNITTTMNPTRERRGFAFAGSLREVSLVIPRRSIAYVDAPSMGEVRPKATDIRSAHLDGPVTGGVCVRTWSPPV